MGKGNRLRAQREGERQEPAVRARVVLGDMNPAGAMDVIRPALLYADEVTVHAPAASLLMTLGSLREITEPVDQLTFLIGMRERDPATFGGLDVNPVVLEQMKALLTQDRRKVMKARTPQEKRELARFYEQIDGMRDLFAEKFGVAMEEAIQSAGAQDLMAAAGAGLLIVEPLGSTTPADALLGVVETLDGAHEGGGLADAVAMELVVATLDALGDASHIPVFDDRAAGLIRSLREQGHETPEPVPGHREVATVAGLLSNLPDLNAAPAELIVELRRTMRDPLTRFRSAISKMSEGFSSESFDRAIQAEIELAWRQTVAPALLEIREGMQEAGVLRRMLDVGMRAPEPYFVAGGAAYATWVAGFAPIEGLAQGLLAAMAAPAALTAIKGGRESWNALQGIRKNDFYFLYAADSSASDAG